MTRRNEKNNLILMDRPVEKMRLSSVVILLCGFHVTSSSVLTQYDGLESDYWKWKESFGPKKTLVGSLFSYFKASPEPDLIQYNESQRKSLCRSFVESNNYVYAKNEIGLLVQKGELKETHLKSSAEFKPDEETRDVVVGPQKDSVKMFQCASDKENKQIFHLIFAQQKDYAFIVTIAKNGKTKNVVFQALLQPDAKIHEETLKLDEKLAKTFWTNVITAINYFTDANKPKNLCLMSENQHFNICSVVADKLFREPSFTKFQSDHSLNYIYDISERCVTKNIAKPGSRDTYEEDVMPCAINDEKWSRPQFYLLRHITSTDLPASVYVLTSRGKGILELFTRIDEVMAMTMP